MTSEQHISFSNLSVFIDVEILFQTAFGQLLIIEIWLNSRTKQTDVPDLQLGRGSLGIQGWLCTGKGAVTVCVVLKVKFKPAGLGASAEAGVTA